METNDKEKTALKVCIQCGKEFGADRNTCPDDGTLLTGLISDDLCGTVLADRYEIIEVVGGGGMGLVYKARHKFMNRIVAIKMLHKHMISSKETLQRFQLEAQAASCLSLPNILTVHDFGLTPEGQPYMVMDYLEGTSLSDILEQEDHLSVDRALNIFIQACAGLSHAHQKGVLHRDIKPSNIMLVTLGEESDFVKIVDFGIAKLLNQNNDNLTKTGEVYGSPSYMSPEQCRGRDTDARSDIYQMGCVMYRALTGKQIFAGDDIIEILFKQVSEPPTPFDTACPYLNIPPEMEAIVFKALAKDMGDRYETMADFKEALETYREKRNSKTPDTPTPLWKRSDSVVMQKPKTTGVSGAAQAPTPATAGNGAEHAKANSAAPADAAKPKPTPYISEPAAKNVPPAEKAAPRRDEPKEQNGASSAAAASAPKPTSSATRHLERNTAPRNGEGGNGAGSHSGGSNYGHGAASQQEHGPAVLRKKMSDKNPMLIIAIAAGLTVTLVVGGFVIQQQLSKSNNSAAVADHGTSATSAGDASALLESGREAYKARQFDKAKDLYEKALTLNRQKFGTKSGAVAETLMELGAALVSLQQYTEAEPILKESLGIREGKAGKDSKTLLPILSSLATAYFKTDQTDLSESTLKRAIAIQEKTSNKDAMAGNLYYQMAEVCRAEHKESDATAYANKSLTAKTASGADSADLETVKTFLASAKTSNPAATTSSEPAKPDNKADTESAENTTSTTAPVKPDTAPPSKPATAETEPKPTTVATQPKPAEDSTAKASEPKRPSTTHTAVHTARHHASAAPTQAAPHRRHAYSSYGF